MVRYIMRILALCGSLQAASANLSLLRTALSLAPAGVDLVMYDGLRDLPHFNPDTEAQGQTPFAVAAWRSALVTSDALLIATPEYGHSLPGVLKNAIDWVIGSGELEGKTVAVTCSAPGPDRGRLGLKAVMDTLGAVRARVVGGKPIVRGPCFESEVGQLLAQLLEKAQELSLAP